MIPPSARVLAALALSAGGCASFERPVDLALGAEGITALVATVDRGDLGYEGTSADTFVLEGTSAGFGSNESQAAHREAGNRVDLVADGQRAVLEVTSEYRRAWVDLGLLGPPVLDLDVWVRRGTLDLGQVEGVHVLTADRITADRLMGSVDALAASGGMDVAVWPPDDGEVLLESSAGDVVLRMPWGRPYDIEVIGDPAYSMFVEDLGFTGTFSEPGYFAATVGEGSIRVTVFVNGGSFQLIEAL